jgi:glycosyltransferase involved in cell wall biosynthesis
LTRQNENSFVRIIWLKSDFVDPPDTGGKIRTYNLLNELNRHSPVTYMSLQSNGTAVVGITRTKWAARVATFPYFEEKKSGLRFVFRVLARMISTAPYIVQKYRCRELRNCQRDFVVTPDDTATASRDTVLICDFLEMTDNVDWSLPCPKVLFQHNVESVIWRRYFENERNPVKKAYFWFEHLRMKRYERRACNRFDLVFTVSSRDREILKQLGVTTRIDVVETGVDTEYFTPRPTVKPKPGRLLFLGSLDWMPNIDGIEWFVRRIYPLVKERCPHVSVDIVGRRPASVVQSLADKKASINVCGSVADVRPYMAEADIFIVPLRIGSGTRLKIFEAFAMKMPVVSTTVGAEGLPVEHGRHLLLADSPTDYAYAISRMLEEPMQKQALANAGYELVTTRYTWAAVSASMHDSCLTLHREKLSESRRK